MIPDSFSFSSQHYLYENDGISRSPPFWGLNSGGSSGSTTCDKCDGKHPTERCPHFQKDREKHKDAWVRAAQLFDANFLSKFQNGHFSVFKKGRVSESKRQNTYSFLFAIFLHQSKTKVNYGCKNNPHQMGGSGGNYVLRSLVPSYCCHFGWKQHIFMNSTNHRATRNARVISQPGDGSCLYHSISFGLGDTDRCVMREWTDEWNFLFVDLCICVASLDSFFQRFPLFSGHIPFFVWQRRMMWYVSLLCVAWLYHSVSI